jgi:hypothetical protein
MGPLLFLSNLNTETKIDGGTVTMSELTIRSPNGAWVDICASEWKVLQEDGTWKEIDPVNDLRVRHGSNDYWLQINCDQDAAYCPPEQLADCWPGYSGNFDSSEFKPGGPTGYLVCDCDGLNCKTYTGHTPSYNVKGGRFISTSPVVEKTIAQSLPTTLFGSEAEITEVLVYAGTRSGHIEVSALELDTGVRVRVYNDCILLGDSDVSGDYFNVFFNTEPPETNEDDCGDPIPANNFLTVRVDAPAGSRWRVKLGDVNVDQITSFQRPAPCFGTFGPNLPCFVNDENYLLPGEAVYENVHYLPTTGRVDIDLTVNGIDPVHFQVFYNGGLIGDLVTNNTPQLTQVAATLTFNHNVVGGDNFVIIRYTAPRQYNDWHYSIFCPGMRGSRINMMECMGVPDPVPYDVLCRPLNESLDPYHAIVSRGAHTADIYYDYAGKARGDIVVEYFATDAVQLLFYQGSYPNETLLAGTVSTISGHNRFYFRFEPQNGSVVHVRVIGPCCPDWAFTMSCPVPPPVLNIADAEIVRGSKGQTSYLCFDVVLENKTPRRTTFNWDTTPLTAIVSNDGSCTVTETVPNSPFCNILATGSGVEAGSSNDTWIGYSCYRIRSSLHSPNCAVGGQYYVVETEIELPYSGTYTIVGCADDNMVVYLDCVPKMSAPSWEWAASAQITANAGWQTLSIMYQNVPNCTPGWAKLVILNSAGQVVFATSPYTHLWRSKVGGITANPPPLSITYGADYNKVLGSGAIEACQLSTRICVPVCGTDLMGPDVTFLLSLKDLTTAEPGKMSAIGTIKNNNQFNCSQNPLDAVSGYGLNTYINRGAYNMYTGDLLTYGSGQKIMEADINIPASGLYTFFFHGMDHAVLTMDCQQIAAVSGAGGGVRAWAPANKGFRKFAITYAMSASNSARPGYAALVIMDTQNRVVYASHPDHWRGKVLNAGTPPSCNQFATSCLISGNSIQEQQSGGGGSTGYTVGYGSVQVRTSLHGNGHQPNGINYSLQYSPNLPAGVYTMLWTADDVSSFYVNCVHVRDKNSNWRTIDSFQFAHPGGAVPLTVIYRNTGGNVAWVNWAILNSAGQAVSVSRPGLPGEASAVGDVVAATVGVPLYNTVYRGRLMTHISRSIGSGGTNYAWWSAERDIVIPADGDYYIVGGADDALGVYIGCQGRGIGGERFQLKAGAQKMQIRCYNYKSGNPNYFWFTLYNSAGQVVYDSSAAGWKGKWTDLDFSGLS